MSAANSLLTWDAFVGTRRQSKRWKLHERFYFHLLGWLANVFSVSCSVLTYRDLEIRVKMASISTLPNEMLDRIFAFLSEDKQAISACRVVCHSFKQLSSPYLSTRVVYARRLKAIARLNEIVEHDYFHKYVTELIYDASCYHEHLAMDWDRYVQGCLNAPQELRDAEWARRKLEDQTIWSKIEELGEDRPGSTSTCVRVANRNRSGEHSGVWLRDDTGEDISNDDISESEPDDDESSEGAGSSSEHEGGALRYYDQAHKLGCHRSFPDYRRLYIAERQIERKGATEQILGRALSRLRSLKSIVVTDWRGLARRNESYNDCACRLFGNTLAPSLMMSHSADLSMLFEQLMWTIEDSKDTCVEQFSIGSHFFEDQALEPNDPRAP